ncbi:pitrilysin family protein [Halocynthiibacter sp. C4]|uniref:M16 family metallopeptidase n=1 Tax=Halocynthiibacter sp. C4 TaxID=2992758 RepID=UPI00237B52C7|nr:pitrilysin family protein [Halocynthiibacter sp. C4]MDE0591117.1 pitrilysin family protein [Halocynthiibacter sp. C4]
MIRVFFSTVLAMLVALPLRAEIAIQDVTSPKGIHAWLVEDHSIPFTAIEVWFKGGAGLDAPGKRGATNLMVGLLEEGAGDLDSQEFAAAVEALAASYKFDVFDDTLIVSAQFLTENRDDAIDLLRSALTEPRFDEASLERVRGQVRSIISGNEKDPNDIASRTLNKLAWGDHPYGSSLNGTLESVNSLTRDDLVEAKNATMTRDRIHVGAVGDITPEELGALLDTLLGDLPEEGAPLPADATYALPRGGETVVEFETPQSVAIFAHEGIARDDDDFFALYVLNHVLGGGGFASVLMEEVREKRGLTYGISTYLVPKEHGALMMGQVASSNDRIAEAITVVRDVWADIAANGITEKQLTDAKTFLTGAYPLRFDGNATIAGIMAAMQSQELPIDYIATRNDKVNAVTLEDIKRVAARVLKPEDLHFVVVGQPEGLGDQQ